MTTKQDQEFPALRLKARDHVVGRDPSTRRVADAYFRFSAAVQLALRKRESGSKDDGGNGGDDEGEAATELEGLYNAFLLELSRLERVTTRLASVRGTCKRQMQNYGETEASILAEIEAAKRDISDLRVRLQDARVERQNKEEYEAAASVVNGGSPHNFEEGAAAAAAAAAELERAAYPCLSSCDFARC